MSTITETAISGSHPRRTSDNRRTARASRTTTKVKYALTVLLFLLPSALPMLYFTIYPAFGALWTSLHKWNLLSAPQWVGLDNYAALLQDPTTLHVLGNTVYYIVGCLPLVYVGGLGLAIALNAAIPFRKFLRGMYFLPVVTSWIVVALIWRWLLNPSVGIVNAALGLFGIDGPGWWTDPGWAMPSIILASAWKDLGYVMIILLAGLQAIPQDLYEAARVDGAGWWARLRHITLPMLSPTTFFVIIILLINGFQVFDQVYAMTGGGPAGASTVAVQQVYDLTFRYSQAGMGSALSWLLFLLVLAVTIVQMIGQRKWVSNA
jgi:multiple sugar transport system permease protein